jgi:hypothetical protein
MRHSPPLLAVIALALASLSTPSRADRAAADACAAKLPAESKLIYAATIGSVVPDANLREVVRSKTRGLVMEGRLSRNQAQSAAEAAGACLRQAQ